MTNPVKKFEIEISPIGIWLTELDSHGVPTEKSRIYSSDELSNDINWLTEKIQIDFDF